MKKTHVKDGEEYEEGVDDEGDDVGERGEGERHRGCGGSGFTVFGLEIG